MIEENAALTDPVTEEDVIDLEEYLDSIYNTQKSFADRIAHQVGETHPVTAEMRYLQQTLDFVARRLAGLRAAKCFPSQDSVPG